MTDREKEILENTKSILIREIGELTANDDIGINDLKAIFKAVDVVKDITMICNEDKTAIKTV